MVAEIYYRVKKNRHLFLSRADSFILCFKIYFNIIPVYAYILKRFLTFIFPNQNCAC
jgi:hypothetical protein